MKKTRTNTGIAYQASVEDQQMLAAAIRSHQVLMKRAVAKARFIGLTDPIEKRLYELMASAVEEKMEAFDKLFNQL